MPGWSRHDGAQSFIDLRLTRGAKVAEELRDIDRTIVFLARYGRIDPWFSEEQDITRLLGLMGIVSDWIAAENGKRTQGGVEELEDAAGDFT